MRNEQRRSGTGKSYRKVRIICWASLSDSANRRIFIDAVFCQNITTIHTCQQLVDNIAGVCTTATHSNGCIRVRRLIWDVIFASYCAKLGPKAPKTNIEGCHAQSHYFPLKRCSTSRYGHVSQNQSERVLLVISTNLDPVIESSINLPW